MFTGIVEAVGTVENIDKNAGNITYTLSCPFSQELKIDQSLAHNGCCLTVECIEDQFYKVTAIHETLKKTNLSSWEIGSKVNLERCMLMNGRLDGHIVQGHVDKTGIVTKIEDADGSFLVSVSYENLENNFITVPQGSITVNGISFTVAKSLYNGFTVAVIPYTWENTNMQHLKTGDLVNLEFDIIGKYIAKLMIK